MRHLLACLLIVSSLASMPAFAADPATPLTITPLAEKKVPMLPEGELYWRVENMPTLKAAKAVATEYALVTERAGKVWLFTLGPKGGNTAGGTKLADVGPLPPTTAEIYLLRVNEASGPRGALTNVHKHDGSEAFYVLEGEQSVRTSHGTQVIKAGQPEAGHGAGMIMQVGSTGEPNLRSLVLFVVDANKPFSSPAEFPAE